MPPQLTLTRGPGYQSRPGQLEPLWGHLSRLGRWLNDFDIGTTPRPRTWLRGRRLACQLLGADPQRGRRRNASDLGCDAHAVAGGEG